MATGFSKTTFNNIGTAPAIDATFLNTLQDFLVAIANGGAGSVVKADDSDAVSAAGIGVTSIPAMASTADNYKTGGIFYCSSAITNAPFYGVKNANILVAPKDANNVTQFAMSVDGSRAIKLRQYTGGAWTAWSEVGGGGSGAVNFLQNKLSENDTSYITNTGCTVTWDTSEDLSVAGSLKIEVSSSGTGRKVEIDLSELSDAQITELCRLSFFYKLTVGADDNVEVYILNGSDKFYFDIPFLAANSGALTKYDAAGMVTNRTGNKLVFGFKDNSAATVYLGDAMLTPRVLPQGAVITEWQNYTPTFQGMGTVTEIDFRWRRVGSNIEIVGYCKNGTVTSTEAQVSLPPGIVTRSTIVAEGLPCGHAFRPNASTTYYYTSVICEPSKTYFGFGAQVSSAGALDGPLVGTSLFTSGEYLSLQCSIPVEGWISSINLVTEAQEFAFNTQATINTNDTTSFGYGPGGTPILKNTANTYHDCQFKTQINPGDIIQIEVRNKLSGAWVPVEQAGCSTTRNLASTLWTTALSGMSLHHISPFVVRVYFGSVAGSTLAGATCTWATMVAASDGYDRWRVRKISNGNSAEAPASGIYESGQNSNGYFVKYIDGTMECFISRTYAANLVSDYWTFPATFAEAPIFCGTAGCISANSDRYVFTGVDGVTTTQAHFLVRGGTWASAASIVFLRVVGRWNLSRSVVAPGTPVGASTVFLKANKTANQAVTASVTNVSFPNIDEETHSGSWDGSQFTCPLSGLYLVNIQRFNSSGGAGLYAYVNGTNVYPNAPVVATSDYDSGAMVVRLIQGQVLSLRSEASITVQAPTGIDITRLSA